jgi:hypothetical protein
MRNATAEETDREGHGSLAGRRIVGGMRRTAQERPSRPRRLARAHERGHGQDNIKARVLSEPSLLLQIARLGGKAGEGVSRSRCLKRVQGGDQGDVIVYWLPGPDDGEIGPCQ